MNKESMKTRNKLKDIGSVRDLESLINEVVLSEEEKQILMLHYREQKTLLYIADILGMSEATIKRKHKRLLLKIGKYF